MNARVRSFMAGTLAVAALVAAPAAGARDVVIPSFDGVRPAPALPGPGPRAPARRRRRSWRPTGWGAVRDKDENSSTLAPFGQVGRSPGAAAQGGLQRAHVGLARLRRVGRHRRGRLQGLRGPRRVGVLTALATQPEQQLDARRRSPRRHDGRVLRGRDRARVRRHRPRASTPIAPSIAWHSLLTRALPRRPRQGRLGCGPLGIRHSHRGRARDHQPGGHPDGDRRPAHHVRIGRGPRHRPPVRREPRLVREPRPRRRARIADPRADTARAGDGRHPVHAQRGDPQLRVAEEERRSRGHAPGSAAGTACARRRATTAASRLASCAGCGPG